MEAQEQISLKTLISDWNKERPYNENGYPVNILGTEWIVKVVDELSNPDIDGLCCNYNKTIYIIDPKNYCAYCKAEEYSRLKLIIRHELIHAFVYESGIDNIEADDEQTTNWLAYQFDKIKKVFEMLEV